jgi:DNA replication protein DnaC
MTKASDAHLFRALKAPAAARATPKLAERAREEQWGYERFLEAVLSTEVASRESHGGESRIKAARFPARKTLEEFDFTFQRSVRRQVVEHLGELDFLHARENVVLLGPPGTGESHLAIAISIRACLAATESPSPPPPSGWLASETPSARATSRPSSNGSASSPCSSLTKWDTSPSIPRRPT